MKQKTKDIIGALLLGLLCTLALSAVITVADTETARTDLMIGISADVLQAIDRPSALKTTDT